LKLTDDGKKGGATVTADSPPGRQFDNILRRQTAYFVTPQFHSA
jgi:hypothetical protein